MCELCVFLLLKALRSMRTQGFQERFTHCELQGHMEACRCVRLNPGSERWAVNRRKCTLQAHFPWAHRHPNITCWPWPTARSCARHRDTVTAPREAWGWGGWGILMSRVHFGGWYQQPETFNHIPTSNDWLNDLMSVRKNLQERFWKMDKTVSG